LDESIGKISSGRELAGIQKRAWPAQRARFFHTQGYITRRDHYAVTEQTLQFARDAIAACHDGPALTEFPMVQFLYGFVLLFHDSVDTADTELRTALAMAERAGEIGQQARCLTYLTLAARRRGSIEETHVHAEHGLAVATQSGMREYLAAAWANQAWVALRRGAIDPAKTDAHKAWDVWRGLTAVFPFHWMAFCPRGSGLITTKSEPSGPSRPCSLQISIAF
jgi:hypothetical protein